MFDRFCEVGQVTLKSSHLEEPIDPALGVGVVGLPG